MKSKDREGEEEKRGRMLQCFYVDAAGLGHRIKGGEA